MNDKQLQAVKQLQDAFNLTKGGCLSALAYCFFDNAVRECTGYFCRLIDAICADDVAFNNALDNLAMVERNVHFATTKPEDWDPQDFDKVKYWLNTQPRDLVAAHLKTSVCIAVKTDAAGLWLSYLERGYLRHHAPID
ncbi:hypothetical protein RFO11_003748 [Escherichia coli]|uniref:hypothetical protein n=1 Tax=Escherichia coli TaxID=562 RepID=UPI000BE14E6F|nr:hypothetical protein [Escherichia coli]EFM3349615.1 hypothetical protein [Escherichia coli]EIX4807807.1 hypothetical protein [Escherichia coli]EKM0456487.1 hypothetical protein [Escherichia coli]ELA3541385.1 hypothetical protein [Escherichia coli]EMB2764347.1 hypothetical protein [Escherichia coli]